MVSEEKPDAGINLGVLVPPKRKQGRPRKDHTLMPLGDKSLILPKPDGRGRKPRRNKYDATWPTIIDSDFIGQQVHGVLDGSFDAGYLLTVRVGHSQTVLRGVVFEPSLSIPISRSNDIAPNVKLARRNEQIHPPMLQPVTLMSPIVSSPVARLSVAQPICVSSPAATQSTAFKEYQPPALTGASTVSAKAVNILLGPETNSPKPAVASHECHEAASRPGDPGVQKMEIRSDTQLQTV